MDRLCQMFFYYSCYFLPHTPTSRRILGKYSSIIKNDCLLYDCRIPFQNTKNKNFINNYDLWLTFGREIAQGEDMEVPLWYPLFEFVYGTPYLVVAPYWFICCLFSIQIIYFLLMKYLPKPLAITIILLCPLLHSILCIYNLPWNLALATLYLPFYAFSNLC